MPDYNDYGDAGEDSTAPSEAQGMDDDEGEGDEEDKDESNQSALLPRSMLGKDLKPGDTITLKVDQIFEDEIMVCPVDSKEKEDSSSSMDKAQGSLDRMASNMMSR